ncbi:MAG: hypothetical protein ACRDGS_06620, partial [Chloroflexota bacterium]
MFRHPRCRHNRRWMYFNFHCSSSRFRSPLSPFPSVFHRARAVDPLPLTSPSQCPDRSTAAGIKRGSARRGILGGRSRAQSVGEVMGKRRILVAMSGGVDSSVAAALLLEHGHEVIGVTMNVWPELPDESVVRADACCSLG